MILDTSAVIAILRKEPDAARFAAAIEAAGESRMSAVSYVEAAVVVDSSRDPIGSRRFDEFMRVARVQIETVDETQARLAREAYRDFGRGSGHPARLNFGDCFAYALAKSTGDSLLYKGEDFGRTDVESALG